MKTFLFLGDQADDFSTLEIQRIVIKKKNLITYVVASKPNNTQDFSKWDLLFDSESLEECEKFLENYIKEIK